MARQQIALVVTFQAAYVGDDHDVPDETTVEETMSLIIPQMEEKFVVLPKVLEGVTDRVIKAHRARMDEYRSKKAAEERARKERAKMFPGFSEEDIKEAAANMPNDGVETTIIYKGVEYPVGDKELA